MEGEGGEEGLINGRLCVRGYMLRVRSRESRAGLWVDEGWEV